MSKQQLTSTLEKQINVLNERIDRKIVTGKSYYRDASRHQVLVRQLILLRQKQARPRLFNFFSFL